jgi:hypothetical protein
MANHPTVYLRGLPVYRQGSNDRLCVYYSACMMLAALYPELEADFGRGDRKRYASIVHGDPLFKQASKNDDPAKALADWFYRGEDPAEAVKYMNAIARNHHDTDKLFEYMGKGKFKETKLKTIHAAIDEGLPVMLSWGTRDMGDHCVVVYGYTKGQKNWLYVNDPGGGGSEICWETLAELAPESGAIGLIVPQSEFFTGARPDKVCYETTPAQELREKDVWRYWPSKEHGGRCTYQRLRDLFTEAVAEMSQRQSA